MAGFSCALNGGESLDNLSDFVAASFFFSGFEKCTGWREALGGFRLITLVGFLNFIVGV